MTLCLLRMSKSLDNGFTTRNRSTFMNPDDILQHTSTTSNGQLSTRASLNSVLSVWSSWSSKSTNKETGKKRVPRNQATSIYVANDIKHCLTCRETQHPAENHYHPLQRISISETTDLFQIHNVQFCKNHNLNYRNACHYRSHNEICISECS